MTKNACSPENAASSDAEISGGTTQKIDREGGLLRAALFADDCYLKGIAEGNPPIEEGTANTHIQKILQGLKLVLPILLNKTPNDPNDERLKELYKWEPSAKYDVEAEGWVKTFKERLRIDIGENQDTPLKRQVIDAETLLCIDRELSRIIYHFTDDEQNPVVYIGPTGVHVGYWNYVYDPRANLFEEPRWDAAIKLEIFTAERVIVTESFGDGWCHVQLSDADYVEHGFMRTDWLRRAFQAGYLTRVNKLEGNRDLHQVPVTGSASLKSLAFNDQVLVMQILPGGWSYVYHIDEEGKADTGYVKSDHLAHSIYLKRQLIDALNENQLVYSTQYLPPPVADPGATLYRLKADDTIEKLINMLTNESGLDGEFCATLLLFLNNPDGRPQQYISKLDSEYGSRSISSSPAAMWLEGSGSTYGIFDLINSLITDPDADLETVESFLAFTVRTWAKVQKKISSQLGGNLRERLQLTPDRASAEVLIWLPSTAYAAQAFKLIDSGSLEPAIADIQTRAEMIVETLTNELFNSIQTKIDLFWPEGLGIALDAAIGATFAVPIDIDAEAFFYIWRSGNSLKLVRKGTLAAGINLELSGGLFLSSTKKPSVQKGDAVLGLRAGVSASESLKLTVLQELTFPIYDDAALAALFFTHLETLSFVPSGPPDLILSTIVSALRLGMQYLGIDPNQYTTKFKVQVEHIKAATAAASAGLEFAGEDNAGRNDLDSYSKSAGETITGRTYTKLVANKLSAAIDLSTNTTKTLAVEYEVKDDAFVLNGRSGKPEPVEYSRKFTFGQSVSSASSVSWMRRLLPTVIAGNIDLKLSYIFDKQTGTHIEKPDPGSYLIGFVAGQGDVEGYTEPGWEITAWYDLVTLSNNVPDTTKVLDMDFDQILDEAAKILSLFHSIDIKLRTGANQMLGSDLVKLVNDSPIAKYKGKAVPGAIYKLFVGTEFTLDKQKAEILLNKLKDYVQDQLANHNDSVVDTILSFFEGIYRNSKKGLSRSHIEVIKAFDQAAKDQKFILHTELGFGLGVGAKLAAGAKARAKVYATARLVTHQTIDGATVATVLKLAGKKANELTRHLLTKASREHFGGVLK